MEKLRVYLEIKKDSNIKYEFDKTKNATQRSRTS